MTDFFLLGLSLFLLFMGAEFALGASEKIGVRLKMSPLMIGMLLVGLGTSLPEFFVSHIAAYRGEPDIAMGNVIGSNLTNIFLVLGSALLFTKMSLASKELDKQVSFHLVMTLVFALLLFRLKFDLLTVLVLFTFFLIYLWLSKQSMCTEGDTNEEEVTESLYKTIPTAVIGFTLLYYGGELLVESGKKVCLTLGLSEYVISVILIAFGTSFPELVTSMLAVWRKKETDLIVGNVIGSNIFNISFVLGTLFPYEFSLKEDLWVEGVCLSLVGLLLFLLTRKRQNISKFLGILFLMSYGGLLFYWLK